MCRTFQRCVIFQFGYSKIFVPFISSGSNLRQILTTYSLPSKGIRLFTPNFTLLFSLFRRNRNNIFPPIKLPEWPILTNQRTTRNFLYFLYFCINCIQFQVIFAALYVTIATHCHFNAVNLYIPVYHCILVFLHSSVESWRELDENAQTSICEETFLTCAG